MSNLLLELVELDSDGRLTPEHLLHETVAIVAQLLGVLQTAIDTLLVFYH